MVYNDALILSKRQTYFQPLFKLGLFESKTPGSQAISEFLGVGAGHACD